jgi:predicted PurR-regulated permease PerM
MSISEQARDFERYAAMAVLVLLVIGCYLVIRPFVTAFIWGGIIAVSTWRPYSLILARLRQRRKLAAALTVLALAATLLGPITALALSALGQWPAWSGRLETLVAQGIGGPPAWLTGLPLVGSPASDYWQQVATEPGRLAQDLRPLFNPVRQFAVTFVAGIGAGLLEFGLALGIAGILYVSAEGVFEVFNEVALRLGGEIAKRQIAVVASTVRGVFNGVIGTAAVQATLAMIGFWIVGAPGVPALGAATLFLSVVPGGPVFLWLPVSIWLYFTGESGWALFMLAWGFFVISGSDNVVRPLLIGQGVQAPLSLVFLGVVGGVLAFGFLGLFIGPVLLAIAYNLFQDWMALRRIAQQVAEGEA